MNDDHYEVLGVAPGASIEEVRAAYHCVMRANHPDVRPGDTAAEETARRANAAWAALRRGGAPTARPPRKHTVRSAAEAYAAHGRAYRTALHAACVKLAAAVLVLGVVVLFGTAP